MAVFVLGRRSLFVSVGEINVCIGRGQHLKFIDATLLGVKVPDPNAVHVLLGDRLDTHFEMRLGL